jgi:gliding motility-associated-like protein
VNGLNSSNDGIYTVQVELNGCLSELDSAEVIQAILPEPADDNYSVEPNGFLDSFNVLINDTYLLNDWNLTVISAPPGLTYLNNGYFTYQAGEQQTEITFFYELCSKACPDLCNMATVRIKIRDTRCEYIPNIITPNDDGSNDFFIIPCLDSSLYPKNSLVVYNQWGDKVYEASPYLNDPDKAWRGTLKGEPGKNLPDATYFYVFTPDPGKQPIKGFVEIFR